MSLTLSDLFSAGELQLAQIAMARASAGCSVFFSTEGAKGLSCLSDSVGKKVSLCCFNPELSLQCGQTALEEAKVSGGHISDPHKCRCGVSYYWVSLPIQNEIAGYCQVRGVDSLSRHGSHLIASYLRTLTAIGNMRSARSLANGDKQPVFASLDPHHLYGHPSFLSLIRMIGEAGRSLLDSNRCLYFSYDSSDQLLCGEFVSDLPPEQIGALQFPVQEFPAAKKATDSLTPVLDGGATGAVSDRVRSAMGDGTLVVVPFSIEGTVLGCAVFCGTKVQPADIAGTFSLDELAKAAASLLAVLGYRIESLGNTDDQPAQVGIIQRYAAMGQMAAEIGHDIQASLYGMKNYAYLLSKAVRDDARKVTYTRAISDGIAYIERLSAEMRKLTGDPRQITLGPTDLGKVIDSAVLLLSPMAGERGITIEMDIDDDIPVLHADSFALTEVFLNLGLNAIHSMKDGGQIRIEARHEGDKVFITVKDNGSGITPEIIERFWNNSSYAARSFTNKGLYIVRRIIRQLDGTIDIDTKPGMGTTFFIRIWVNPEVSVPKTESALASFRPPTAAAPAKSALT